MFCIKFSYLNFKLTFWGISQLKTLYILHYFQAIFSPYYIRNPLYDSIRINEHSLKNSLHALRFTKDLLSMECNQTGGQPTNDYKALSPAILDKGSGTQNRK